MNINIQKTSVLILAILLTILSAGSWARTIEYVHTDALGSIVVTTDEDRMVLERREYEPYGYQLDPLLEDGPGYTGHVQDAATGLVYMQQRYFDPLAAKFLSVDPINVDSSNGSNFNRYAYADNNPYTKVDPDGEAPHIIVGGIIGGVIGGGMELVSQIRSGEEIDLTAVGVRTLTGAIVGAATVAIPGSGAAVGGLARTGVVSQAGMQGGRAVAYGATGDAAAQFAIDGSVDGNEALAAGVSNLVGFATGQVVSGPIRALYTNPGNGLSKTVTSSRGRTFANDFYEPPTVDVKSTQFGITVMETSATVVTQTLQDEIR